MSGMNRLTAGDLYFDEDGDVCVKAGSDNLVLCPAVDENGAVMHPDIISEMVRLYNAHRRASQAAPAPVAWQYQNTVVGTVFCADRLDYYYRPYGHRGQPQEWVKGVPLYSQPATTPPASADDLREAARLILSQPKRSDTLTAEAFHEACGFLDEQDGGEETTNEIIEAFLKHIAGED